MGGFKPTKISGNPRTKINSIQARKPVLPSIAKTSHGSTPRTPSSFKYRYGTGKNISPSPTFRGSSLLGKQPTWRGPVALAEGPHELTALGTGIKKVFLAIGQSLKTAWDYWRHRPVAFGLLMAFPPTGSGKDAEFFSQPFASLGLPEEVNRSLRNSGMETIGELVKMSEHFLQSLLKNERHLERIKNKLSEHGLGLGMNLQAFKLIPSPKETTSPQTPPSLYKEPVLQEGGGKYFSIFPLVMGVSPRVHRQVEANPHTRIGRVKKVEFVGGPHGYYLVTFETLKRVDLNKENLSDAQSNIAPKKDLTFRLSPYDHSILQIQKPKEYLLFYPREERLWPRELNFTHYLFYHSPMSFFVPDIEVTNLTPHRFLLHLSQGRIPLEEIKRSLPQKETYESIEKGLEEIKEALVNRYEYDISPEILERYSWGMAQTRLLEGIEDVMLYLGWSHEQVQSFFYHRNPNPQSRDRIILISYLGYSGTPDLPSQYKSVVKFLGGLATLSVYLDWDFKSMVHEVLAETTDRKVQNQILHAMGRLGLIQ